MTDDQFERLIRDAAVTYNRPPEPPLDEMWAAIEDDRAARPGARPRLWPPGLKIWLPLAAVFALGIVLGRASSSRRIGPSGGASGASSTSRTASAAAEAETPLVARTSHDELATSQYLGQTTALLVALPSELNQPLWDSSFVAHASDLLLTTRLLLDSPAASDIRLRTLLEDLELVLAQVIRLQHDRSPAEIDLINQALEQRDVIPRLRSAVVDHSVN